ncbi:MAG: Glycosyltransferase, group 1 family protein [Candidatus Beckwithbacteria bacterium GW2011_GWC2_49_11]|nr:MAG: Glycosyltransferase, group 1 family protein [Candidatus Beckwithbacteria bacterium GW2011_GWC2_49_11]
MLIGGVEKHVEEVSARLAEKGHQITVVTLKHKRGLAEIASHRGIKIVRLPYSNSKWGIWLNLWRRRSLIQKADLVHCHDVFFWYLPFSFLYPKKPVFTTFHGWEGKFPVPAKNKLARKIWESLSSGNICVGDYLINHYGTKAGAVTYGGIDVSIHQNFIGGRGLREVIFIGRLEPDLAVSEYLKALKQIKARYNLKITFVGDGSLRGQAEKLGQVTGLVKDIGKFLNRPAYIFASSYLTILEKKDYLTLFPGAKFIFIAGSASQLVSQFESARNKSRKIDRMIQAAYRFAQTQTWDKVVESYLEIWQK